MPETTTKYHRIPNPNYKKPDNENIRTIALSESQGIFALYEINTKQIRTYLFDKDKWSMSEAQQWVKDHSKNFDDLGFPENLIAKSYVEKSNEEDGILDVAVASSGIVDRYGEIVDPNGWDLKNFKKNPVFLWGHNVAEYNAPIGRVEKIWTEGEGKNAKLMFKPRFDMNDAFAANLFRKYKEGFLNAFSVGFRPIETDVTKDDHLVYTKSELLEISAVAVPANPEALVSLKEAGIEAKEWKDYSLGDKEDDSEKFDTDKLEQICKDITEIKSDIKSLKERPEELKEEIPNNKPINNENLRKVLRTVNFATAQALRQLKGGENDGKK